MPPGGVQLRSLYDGERVVAYLTIRSRRPATYAYRLRKVLNIGKEAIFDRRATEADFMTPVVTEADAGTIAAVRDRRSIVNVSTQDCQ